MESMTDDDDIMQEYIDSNNENIKNYRKDLKKEINKLLLNEWQFLSKDWKKITSKYKHRTKIKNVKNVNDVKKELLNKLGYIPVFFFLTMLYTHREYPGPYLEIEKGLMILYHLVSGITSKDIEKYIPYSSFYAVYKKFWVTNYTQLNTFVNHCLKNMFSNIKIRILSGLIKNPVYFKNITLVLMEACF